MPDHLHLLVEGQRQDSDLRDFVRQLKQRTAFAWTRIHGDALWQRGCFDHVLRDEEDALLTVARYILANPVRAGLVDAPEAYSFSGSLVMERRDLLASI